MSMTTKNADLDALVGLSERAIQGVWTIGKIESDGVRVDCGDWEQIAYLWQTTRRYVPGDDLDATGPEFGVDNPQANAEFICALVNWFRANKDALTHSGAEGDARDALRTAVADYMFSEGCNCCRGDEHEKHGEAIAKLLGVSPFDDGSGYDFSPYRTAAILSRYALGVGNEY
jgi:hypothetical protein